MKLLVALQLNIINILTTPSYLPLTKLPKCCCFTLWSLPGSHGQMTTDEQAKAKYR